MKISRWLVLITLMAAPLYASTTTMAYQKALDEYQGDFFQAALGDLNTVLNTDPTNWKALELMAYCFYKQGNTQESLQSAWESLKFHPYNPPLVAFVDRQEHGGIATEEPQGIDKYKGKEWESMPSPPDLNGKTDGAEVTAPPSQAAPASAKVDKPKESTRPVFRLGPLVSIPMSSNTSTQFLAGPGVEASLMFPSNDHESMGFVIGLNSCPLNSFNASSQAEKIYGGPLPSSVVFSGDLTYVPVLFLVRYYSDKVNQGFYMMGGAGLAFNSINMTIGSGTNVVTASASETDLLCSIGAGVDFKLWQGGEGFIQARLDLDFTSSQTDVATLSGPGGSGTATGSLTGDNPTMFLPLQIGLRL